MFNIIHILVTFNVYFYFSDAVRKVSKKILRILDNETHVISVYGIVKVDLSLPLNMIILIAKYAIILMEFTML